MYKTVLVQQSFVDDIRDFYIIAENECKVKMENRDAYYNYLQLRLDYLKGRVKEKQQKLQKLTTTAKDNENKLLERTC